MPARRVCFWLTAGAVTLAGGLAAAVPAYATQGDSTKASSTKAGSAGTAPNAAGSSPSGSSAPATTSAQKPAATQHFDIDDFAVQGADTLPQIEIEEAIYQFLGPNKTADDVEKARAALEKAYHDKGYQTVSVSVPEQNAQAKVITLKVTELKVGRLRVKNSHYFDIDKIKQKAVSLKEGTVPNFTDVTKDIVSLNQWPDRRVTPALRAGEAPGTVDVDLNVEDKVALHGTVEVNNRSSPNTSGLRFTSTVHYDDVWQRGDSFSFSYQVAPQRPSDAEVFSGSYLARIDDVDWLSVLLYAVKSNSDVAVVGGTDIVGPGQIVGVRAVITLPGKDNFFQTLSVGPDYKHFDQDVGQGVAFNGLPPLTPAASQAVNEFASPVTYFPVVASYTATFQNDKSTTQLDAAVTYNTRPLSSDPVDFDNKRFAASGSFIHLNADLSHTQELPEGFQLYGKVLGQVADGPLVSSEQLSLGGLDTVRGYLESEVLGDNGIVGNIELRSPNIGDMLQKEMKDETGQGAARFTTFNEWRFFGFADAGTATVLTPLPEQQAKFDMWSYGIGARFKVLNYLNGTLIYSVPMISQTYTQARDPRVNFRLWGEF
jgi:hemolysin activation/secretion protein